MFLAEIKKVQLLVNLLCPYCYVIKKQVTQFSCEANWITDMVVRPSLLLFLVFVWDLLTITKISKITVFSQSVNVVRFLFISDPQLVFFCFLQLYIYFQMTAP